ncbi:CHAT domain-containing protein [Streptomyces sp. NPDC001536]|uniref:CHAT domain-containing protein n=1 Tax=Streptomyces sp. NPDC001536 TaxID=3364583 RepID=UPI00367F4D20
MEATPYDLSTLLWEIQQTMNTGGLDGQDLGRLSTLVLDRLGCRTATQAYDRLYDDWAALPPATLLSGMRAGQVLSVLPLLRLDQPLADGRREEELWRAAQRHGPADEQWQATVLAMNGLFPLQHAREPADLEVALARIETARTVHPDGTHVRARLDLAHAGIRAHLAQLSGGEDDYDAAVDDMARVAASPALDEATRLAMEPQVALFRAQQAARREDEPLLVEQIRVLEAALARMSPDHMDRLTLESNVEAARGYLTILRGQRSGRLEPAPEGAQPAVTVAEVRRQIAALPRNAQADRLGEAGFSRGMRAMIALDYHGILEALELREAALDLLEPDDDRWLRNAGSIGTGHCAVVAAEIAPPALRPHHLDQGIAWLRHTLRLMGGPHHPLWGGTALSLARAYRMRGELHPPNSRTRHRNAEESRRVGLEALRATARGVLLQSGTAHAAETGRRAGEQAVEVARWCVADGAHTDAVRALDAGRGLVLHAATVATTVPDMLGELGRPDLADEWRAAGSGPEPGEEALLTGGPAAMGPSSRLRRRVLEALTASPVRRRLLETPEPEEIGHALRTMGRTALVYLMPGEEHGIGAALIVSADASVQALPLPQLDLEAPPLADYRTAGTLGRDAGGPPTTAHPSPPPRPDTGTAALKRLCDWAGTAVMRPLLKVLPRGFGRVPSVVLVPMAELGAVPWHAARTGARRHACQDADISYLPSARLLCEIAARPAVAPPADQARQALVVGNPTRDLHHAGEEAEAVHRTFHPHGELLGPGTATPAAVTDWLRRQRGGLLHLACHGEVRSGERHSAGLVLSGGQLAAEELTEGASRYDGLDLAVLAACRTNVSGRGYDEAYSLSTAFLVAGARSVIGSLWPVPDEATSLLMYMTHHYLSSEGQTPGPALRSAQLWMLNDRRAVPPGMPSRLRERVHRIRADDLTAWAGFTHLGW